MARNCVRGAKMASEYCERFKLPHDRCGKIICAPTAQDAPVLQELLARGNNNGVKDLEIHVKLQFSPLKPANYYQRVFMLVENRQPLFVDLLGTSYVPARGEVKEQRPAPLRHAHVQAFRNLMQDGLCKRSPDDLVIDVDQRQAWRDEGAALTKGGGDPM